MFTWPWFRKYSKAIKNNWNLDGEVLGANKPQADVC